MTKTEIKSIRLNLGLTTLQLADKVGVSPRTVEGWEQGRPASKLAIQVILLIASPKIALPNPRRASNRSPAR